MEMNIMNNKHELLNFLEKQKGPKCKNDVVKRFEENLKKLTKWKSVDEWVEVFDQKLEREEFEYQEYVSDCENRDIPQKTNMVFEGEQYNFRNRTNFFKESFSFAISREGFDFWNELLKSWSKEGKESK
jgi:hypothetical protein